MGKSKEFKAGDTAWLLHSREDRVGPAWDIHKVTIVSHEEDSKYICDNGYEQLYVFQGVNIFRTREEARNVRKSLIAGDIKADIELVGGNIYDLQSTVAELEKVMGKLKDEYKKLTGQDFDEDDGESKREKLQKKKDRLRDKMRDKVRKMGRALSLLFVVPLFMFVGCRSADPASRSNNTEYGDMISGITLRDKSTMNIYMKLGDGLFASADGGGDQNTSDPSMDTDLSPTTSLAWGASTSGVGGEQKNNAVSGLEKILKALKASKQPVLTDKESEAVQDCVGGNCSPQ